MISKKIVLAMLLLFVISGFCRFLFPRRYTFESEEKVPPPPGPDFTPDDKLSDEKVEFDPALVDSRSYHNLLINKSAAVIKLDSPGEYDETLYPSYADAMRAAFKEREDVLLSINYIDGKAKQIDDGLYAALERAYYYGIKNVLESHVSLIRRLLAKTGQNKMCKVFLAAGLHYAGIEIDVQDKSLREKFKREFEEDELRSKPISFYTWNEDLKRCCRITRK